MKNSNKTKSSHMFRRALLGTACALIASAPTYAQDAAEDAGDDDAIIVTAQKREQDIQDVPISMSVVGGETLANMGVKDMTELDRFVPNFYVQTTPGNNAFYIRGIGTPPGSLAFEQTVGLFVDGIYGGHARQFVAPFVDVERVEILRGPQGALVGKNTSAGAISVVNRKPTDKTEFSLEGSHEFEIGGNRVLGIASGPLSDKVKARVAVLYEDTDGYITNAALGGKEPKRQSFFGRGTFVLDTNAGIDATLKIEGGNVKLTGTGSERITNPAVDPDLIRTSGGFPGMMTKDTDKTNSFNATLTTNFELGGGHMLTAISGYSHFDMVKNLDSDFGTSNIFFQQFAEKYDQFSQEVRLVSSTDNALEYVTGIYGHNNDYYLRSHVVANGLVFPVIGARSGTQIRQFYQDNSAWSAYASATYKFTDALRLIGSIRYTWEKKSARQTRDTTGNLPPTVYNPATISGKFSEGEWDP